MEVVDAMPVCPFCPFSVASKDESDTYFLMQHLELCHPENGYSPFIADEDKATSADDTDGAETTNRSSFSDEDLSNSKDKSNVYMECPLQCGETVTIAELTNHLELHAAEGTALEEEDAKATTKGITPQLNNSGSDTTHQPHSSSSLRAPSSVKAKDAVEAKRNHSRQKNKQSPFWEGLGRILVPSPKKRRTGKAKYSAARRLGRSELGPYAYEERMPAWLLNKVETGAKVSVVNQLNNRGQIVRVEKVANETDGILPVLARLCEQDPTLSKVFLCHSRVKHVVKMAREGGFCGYRNIQMMVSFIQEASSPGHEYFPGRLPSILRLQDMIEAAWDQGINSSGRIETGGIKGTRKYIGTPEAQALFVSLGIGCDTNAFNAVEQTTAAYQTVFEAVMEYFAAGVTDPSAKVYKTSLPPIYFQHPGHSLTIVGFEIRKSGAMNLLVFDPMFKPSPGVCRLVGGSSHADAHTPEKLLKAYRRGENYLQKYNSFEILKLNPSSLLADR